MNVWNYQFNFSKYFIEGKIKEMDLPDPILQQVSKFNSAKVFVQLLEEEDHPKWMKILIQADAVISGQIEKLLENTPSKTDPDKKISKLLALKQKAMQLKKK
jgi:hypothetical protein